MDSGFCAMLYLPEWQGVVFHRLLLQGHVFAHHWMRRMPRKNVSGDMINNL